MRIGDTIPRSSTRADYMTLQQEYRWKNRQYPAITDPERAKAADVHTQAEEDKNEKTRQSGSSPIT